jgi:type I restriction enzyme S subunit
VELKPGYKQTEMGVIPADWDAVHLRKLGKFKNGINKGSEAFGHGHPFVNLMDVFGVCSIASSNSLGLVDTNSAEHKTYDLRKGDVIFIRSSVKPSGVGLTAVVEKSLPQTVYSGFLIRFRDDDALDIGFKRHCFYASRFRNTVIAASSVSANTNINQNNLKNLLLALPPTKREQRAIATALSDVDALLTKLDQLIAKKRDLKQAAMQQLLTGQTRLPGFGGEWEVKRLGEVIEKFVGGGTPSRSSPHYWGDEIPWVTVKDFTTFNPCYSQEAITREGLQNSASHLIPKGTLITSTRMALGKAVVYEVDVAINQDLKALFPKPILETKYLYFWFQYHGQSIDELGSGSTVKGISLPDLKKIEFQLPPRPEQTAIATVLSDMDTELAALEARRDKTHALKQGMMQELLTGKTRLV